MVEIYLTRHGQTIWNLEKRLQGCKNSELTELGVKQAEALRDRLKDIDIDIIYASPIKRAYETARIAKGDKNIKLITDERLVELNFGDYEGHTEEELLKEGRGEEIAKIFAGEMNIRSPKGETLQEVQNRIKSFFKDLISKEDGKKVLIVTHGAVLKVIIGLFRREKGIYSTIMEQASLSKIVVNEGKIEIKYLNDGTHLKNLHKEKIGW